MGFSWTSYEVTNKQFKEFIDQGGYTNQTVLERRVY